MLGGNALKEAKTRRYQRDEYLKLAVEMKYILSDQWSLDMSHSIPESYKTKQSFGDLDVLLCNFNFTPMDEIKAEIVRIFNPTEIYRNGNCISFDYKELQIDFIMIAPEEWETSQVYYSYNDLGNFMGRTARDLGFRYGAYGLAYDFEDTGARIYVSSEPSEIFAFLGYDYDQFQRGFQTMEDVFKYVINSKYFNKRSFAYENLNHVNRSRNLKRKSYVEFMAYIENVDKPNFVFESKPTYLNYAFKHFNGSMCDRPFIEQWTEYHNNMKIKEMSKEIFSGKHIAEYFPSVDTRNYKEFIKNYKESVAHSVDSTDQLAFEIYTLEIGDTDVLMREFALVNKLKFNSKTE